MRQDVMKVSKQMYHEVAAFICVASGSIEKQIEHIPKFPKLLQGQEAGAFTPLTPISQQLGGAAGSINIVFLGYASMCCKWTSWCWSRFQAESKKICGACVS